MEHEHYKTLRECKLLPSLKKLPKCKVCTFEGFVVSVKPNDIREYIHLSDDLLAAVSATEYKEVRSGGP